MSDYGFDVVVFDGRYWGRAWCRAPGRLARHHRSPFDCPWVAGLWAVKLARKFLMEDSSNGE